MFESWETTRRITEAKRLAERLVGHAHYLLDICENNAIILYSDKLSKQIPRSYAANSFIAFREALHQIEIVRLSALWDPADIDNEAIPSVIELIDQEDVISALADAARAQYTYVPGPPDENEPAEERESFASMMKELNEKRGEEHAQNAIAGLRKAIADGQAMHKSEKLKSIRNLRNKHVAHYVTQTRAEKGGEIIAPMKVGDERPVLEISLNVIELLYCWVNGTSISFDASRKFDRQCAEELWNGCTFTLKKYGA